MRKRIDSSALSLNRPIVSGIETNYKKKTNRRNGTRSRAWGTTTAIIKIYNVAGYGNTSITGQVDNIGAMGMFLKTSKIVPLHARVEITIDFNSDSPSTLCVNAQGEIVRRCPEGVGIKFIQINLDDLQECLLERMRMSS